MRKTIKILAALLFVLYVSIALADNLNVTEGSGKVIASDDIGGVLHQRVKISVGADGAATDLSNTAPMPAKVTDGTNTAAVRDTGSSDSLNVAITDASGNQITSFGGGTEYTEDAATAANPVGQQLMGRRRDTLTGAEVSTDGDVIAVNTTSKGEVYVKQTDAVPVTDNAGSLTVDGTVTVTDGAGALNVIVDSITAGNNNIGDVDIASFPDNEPFNVAQINGVAPSMGNGASGTGVQRVTIASDSTGQITCNAGTNLNTSSLATSANQSTEITSLQLLDDVVATAGSAALTKGNQVAGTDGTNARILSTNTSGHLNIADGGNTITVDGTIAATQSGTWSNRLTDGTNTATVRDLGSSDSLNVAITDGSGNQITSFGGGTQYTEADTDASITGTAVMWEDTSDTLRAVSSSKPLPVNVVAGGAGDGSILDGVSSGIKATVLDYANSNPIACRLTDTNGDYVGAGAGTQYTEDVAAAADPIGTMLIARRKDTLSGAEVSADGDNIALNSTSKGELRTNDLSAGNYLSSIESVLYGWDLTDDAAYGIGVDRVRASGSIFDDVSPDSVNEGDIGITRMSANRNLYSTIRDAAGNERGVNVTAGNALVVDGSGVTQPVSGTVGATQSGTWVLGANSGVDIGDVTLNNATLAVTQSGTWDEVGINDSGNSITVDGTLTCNAGSGTLTTSDTATQVDDAGFTPATGRIMMAGFEFDDTTPDSVNEGDGGAARMSANRNIYTTLRDAAGNERGANVNASNQLEVAVGNTVTINSPAVTNAGTFAVQESGSALTALQLIDDGVATTGSAVPAKGMQATGTDGTNARALKTDSGGELQIDVLTLPALAAGTNNIGDVDVLSFPDNEPINVAQMNGVAVTMGNGASGTGVQRVTIASDSTGIIQPVPGTTGGLTLFRSIDLDETEEEIKATAGQMYSYYLFNAASSTRYFKFYNATAANVTVGSTTPVLTLPVPAGAAANVSIEGGAAFATAITAACTTGLADADTGAPAANECIANIYYK